MDARSSKRNDKHYYQGVVTKELNRSPSVLLIGQTPPPWHGQAVATQILFDHDWPEFKIHRLRMEFSHDMDEVGRFRLKKLIHLLQLIVKGGRILAKNPGAILFYPPASAKWVPFLRDVFILLILRRLAGKTVFIYHASSLPVFCDKGIIRSWLAHAAYGNADVSLEVAQEKFPPHRAFHAQSWHWCPCAIEVPNTEVPKHTLRSHIEVLFVGSLQEGKGVLEILRTANILKKQGQQGDFVFRIVGKWFSSAFESEALHMHQEFDLSGMVVFEGQLTGNAKWDAYTNADVFFFPTHYESEASPIVLMEALGMGLRVISTEWAGIPALLDGCPTAQLLPIRSPESYARAMQGVFVSKHMRNVDASKSKKFYSEKFLPEQFISRVRNAFHECAQSSRSIIENNKDSKLQIMAYLADQHPKLGRSLGIARMTEVVLRALAINDGIQMGAVVSKSSVKAPENFKPLVTVPWCTRNRIMRAFTDNLHPLLSLPKSRPDVWYFPKGFMPRLSGGVQPSVATIHDTIIQYYQDHYPRWRPEMEYNYWAAMLRNTLIHATEVMTVSQHAKGQILSFIRRHNLPEREIHVTSEPCLYENIPQPHTPAKADYVLHLASREPHKRTTWLLQLWEKWSTTSNGKHFPKLHVVGQLPDEMKEIVSRSSSIAHLPFLEDQALISQFIAAKALLFPSEIEGFGLPAIEAYYLGTPVCFVKGTSVEEVLGVATHVGGFVLDEPESFKHALEEVLRLPEFEIRCVGLALRQIYAASKVVDRMMEVFLQAAGRV